MRLRSRALTQSLSPRMAPLAALSCLRWSGGMEPRWAIPCAESCSLRFPAMRQPPLRLPVFSTSFPPLSMSRKMSPRSSSTSRSSSSGCTAMRINWPPSRPRAPVRSKRETSSATPTLRSSIPSCTSPRLARAAASICSSPCRAAAAMSRPSKTSASCPPRSG